MIEELVVAGDPDEMARIATLRLGEYAGTNLCGIALKESEDVLRYRWINGVSANEHPQAKLVDTVLPIMGSFTEQVFRSKETVHLPDYGKASWAMPRFGVKSAIFTPIHFAGESYGVLVLLNLQHADAYAPEVGREVGRLGRVLGAAFREEKLTHALHEKQAFLQMALDAMRDDFFVFDLEGQFLCWNRRLRESTGFTDEEIARLRPFEFFHPDDREHVRAAVEGVIRNGIGGTMARLINRQGKFILHDAQGIVMWDENGEPIGVVGTARDVTEQVLAERALAAERTLLAVAFDSLSEILMVTDVAGRIERSNPAAERAFLKSSDLLRGMQVAELFAPMYWPTIQAAMDHIEVRSEVEFNAQLHDALYAEHNYYFRLMAVRDASGSIFALVLSGRDCTEELHRQEKLQKLAHTDALTGLSNRVYLLDRLKEILLRETRSSRGAVLLFVDLDGFKGVNDRFGHQVGDRLLRLIGERLRHTLRRADTVARIGGDEFVVLLAEVDDAEVPERTARHILEVFALPFNLNGQLFAIGASIGIACTPENGAEAETLLLAADRAMYEAKAAGRGCYRRAVTVN